MDLNLKKRVWLDCDISAGLFIKDIDDAIALGYALLSRTEIELVGVSTVFGNTSAEKSSKIATRLINASHRPTLRVHQGANSTCDESTSPAETALLEALSEGNLTIILTGPCTNLARVVSKHPSVIPQITSVLLLGGHWDGQPAQIGPRNSKFPDKNLDWDFASLILLIHAKLPLTFLPVSAIRSEFWSESDFSRLSGNNITWSWLSSLGKEWSRLWKLLFAVDGAIIWDVYLVALAFKPDSFKSCPVTLSTVEKKNYASFPMNVLWPAKSLPSLHLNETSESTPFRAVTSLEKNLKDCILDEILKSNLT